MSRMLAGCMLLWLTGASPATELGRLFLDPAARVELDQARALARRALPRTGGNDRTALVADSAAPRNALQLDGLIANASGVLTGWFKHREICGAATRRCAEREQAGGRDSPLLMGEPQQVDFAAAQIDALVEEGPGRSWFAVQRTPASAE